MGETSNLEPNLEHPLPSESGVSPVPHQPPHSTTLARFSSAFYFALRAHVARSHSPIMPPPKTPWPHAPTHQLSERATYFVTAGTYLKEHHFRSRERLSVLHRGLLTVARDFDWDLEAWAVFSNHYHFVAKSPRTEADATSLSRMLGELHTKTAIWINRLDQTPGRQVWHNFWETKLTYQKSYLARLHYTHQNAVKHEAGAGG
ncbi:MAG: transposase [Verrucomicrobiales bacterium]|nr:transposase [Verrucomicrobiales bacterium]